MDRPAYALLSRLGTVVAVDSFKQAMTVGALGCVMGHFYKHMETVQEWLMAQGISAEQAAMATGSYFNTFNQASKVRTLLPPPLSSPSPAPLVLRPPPPPPPLTIGPLQVAHPETFAELVAEQTPGGMNEQVIADVVAAGGFDHIKTALDKLLPRLLG